MERVEASTSSALQELVRMYLPEFQTEIRKMLDDIDLSLVNLEAEPGCPDHFHTLYERYHAIGGLLGLMRELLGQRLAVASEALVEAMRKYRSIADLQGINHLVQSARFLRRIVTDEAAAEDSRFSGELGQHLQSMVQARADLMMEIRQPLEQETRIGEILIREGAMDEAEVAVMLSKQQAAPEKTRFGEMLLKEKRVEASDIIRAIRMQKLRSTPTADPSVGISLSRLDEVVLLVEALQARSRDIQAEALLRFGTKDRFTADSAGMVDQLTALRTILRSLRMVALRHVFARLIQTVGSLIEESHRSVRVTTLGEAIEVDKELSDQLLQPLADLLALFLEATGSLEGDASLGLLEVVAYREADGLHVDLTGDAFGDLDTPPRQAVLSRVAMRLGRFGGRIHADDIRGTGIRARIVFAEEGVDA